MTPVLLALWCTHDYDLCRFQWREADGTTGFDSIEVKWRDESTYAARDNHKATLGRTIAPIEVREALVEALERVAWKGSAPLFKGFESDADFEAAFDAWMLEGAA